ncbi:MAG: hypothetical protein RLZZ337_466 [Bacteroidota bacterium]|jgi:outer membrane protein TolC
MKYNSKLLFVIIWLIASISAIAQNQPLKLSLEQAQEMAIKNNQNLKNALLDIDRANYQVDEIKSMGLPQVSGSGSFSHTFEIPTQVIPGDAFGQPGQTIPVQFGVPFSMSGSFGARQLLFDGTFFLGLKAASEFVNISRLMASKSEIDVNEGVIKAYYMALISNENISQLDQSLANINKLKNETQALYDAGFAEKLDVDRLVLSASNLEININNLKNQADLAKKVLLNSMGVDVNQPVELTSTLPNYTPENFALNYGSDFNLENRIEYKLLNQQQSLNYLDMKQYKVGYFPSLYAGFNYGWQTFGTQGNFNELGNKWYPNGMYSLSLNVPIFDGFYKKAKVNQTKVEIAKTENTIKQLTNGINLEVSQARTQYLNAIKTLELQGKSVKLAESIYNTTAVKFKEGVGSSFEMITAESDLTTAKTNYLNAMYDLSVAKINLDKAIGNFNNQ